jgi:hypothetical protein
MDDKESGKIIGKGTAKSSYTILLTVFYFTLHYTVSVTVKDGRYRYEIFDFYAQDDAASSTLWSIDQIVTGRLNNGIKTMNNDGSYKSMFGRYTKLTGSASLTIAESLKKAMVEKNVKSDDF